MQSDLLFGLGICAVLAICIGCRPAASDSPEIQIDLTVDPSPPRIGDADVSVTLTDANGLPLEVADVRVEGNMNHAGMKPSFAELQEVEPGRYSGTLEFTMGGDWFILVTAQMLDGKTAQRKIDLPGVRSP